MPRQPIQFSCLRYDVMVGVGGIGTGRFFALEGDHTLGREESRQGRFLDRKDYCKLHIVTHYVQTLLGPAFATFPVGKVGDDEAGKAVLQEMMEAGIDLSLIGREQGLPTLFSFCLVYPDGSGGNVTTGDSAASRLGSDSIYACEPVLTRYAGRGLAVALPEAPLDARIALLRLSAEHGFFRAASFTAQEMDAVVSGNVLRDVDLLAVNAGEAAALSGGRPTPPRSPEGLVRLAVKRARSLNPSICMSITAGRSGSWIWDGTTLAHLDALPVETVGTAGAGDAHMAGLIVGLTCGLDMQDAHWLAVLVAAASTTSPHTIHPGLDRALLGAFARSSSAALPHPVLQLLGNPTSWHSRQDSNLRPSD